MRRPVEWYQFALALIGAIIACFLFFNERGKDDGKFRENITLRMELVEKNIAEYNSKQDRIMEALTDIKLTLKDKQDRK